MIAGIAGSSVMIGQSAGRSASAQRARTRPLHPDRVLAEEPPARPRAPRPQRPGLEELPRPEAPLAASARVAAAARAFSAGNGYLTGLLIDRTI
jgi:hypothetical protein